MILGMSGRDHKDLLLFAYFQDWVHFLEKQVMVVLLSMGVILNRPL